MTEKTLYEDRHFRVISEGDEFILHFSLANKSYCFNRLELENLISKPRPELETALDKKIIDSRLLLIDQGLSYDSVGFVLAQAYAVYNKLVKELNIPECQSWR